MGNGYLRVPLVTEKGVLFKPKSHCYNWIIKRKHPFEKITLEVNIMNKVVAF